MDDEEFCDPHNEFCINDGDDCQECAEFWLDFHAEGLREAYKLRG